jgi:hypothetical protein
MYKYCVLTDEDGCWRPDLHSALEHALHEDVLEVATTIENSMDLNDLIEAPVDDSPRRLLLFTPTAVADGPQF